MLQLLSSVIGVKAPKRIALRALAKKRGYRKASDWLFVDDSQRNLDACRAVESCGLSLLVLLLYYN